MCKSGDGHHHSHVQTENTIKAPPDVKGLTLELAIKKLNDSGFEPRTVKVDGKSRIVTRDMRHDRVNLELTNNLVVQQYLG